MVNHSNKDIDTSLYNEKSLYLLNIRELRDIGRKFGVPSPTTMKKQDLISYILKIVYGEIEAPARTNFGRPNVREFNVGQYLSKIKKNSDMTDELLKLKLDDSVNLGMGKVASPSNEPEFNIENRVYIEKDGKGYLRVHGFIESERDFEIDSNYAKSLKLENFDVLEVKVEDNMFKVITVNGVSLEDKFKEFEINDEKLVAGKNKVFYVRTKEEREEMIEKIAKKCNNLGIKLLVFAQKKHNVSCTDLIEYNKDDGYPLMYKNFMKMISECEKLVVSGEDIVILLEDAIDIEEMSDSFGADVNFRLQNNISSIFKKLLGLGNLIVSFRIQQEIKF